MVEENLIKRRKLGQRWLLVLIGFMFFLLMDFASGTAESLGAPLPTPMIRVNGQRGDVSIDSNTTNISISCQMKTNGNSSDADWWLVRVSPDGTISYLDLSGGTLSWQPGLSTTYQGPLMDFPDSPIVNILTSSMSPGKYTFFFGVDTNMNGQLDMDLIVYDYVTVESKQAPSGTGALVVGPNSVCVDNQSYKDLVDGYPLTNTVPFFDEERNAYYYDGCDCGPGRHHITAFLPGRTCQEVCINSSGKIEGYDLWDCENSIVYYDLESGCPPCPGD